MRDERGEEEMKESVENSMSEIKGKKNYSNYFIYL